MSDIAIRVENLSKRYIIGHQIDRKDGLRHVIERAVRAPARWLRSGSRPRNPSKEEFWAVRDLNFEVNRGEVLGVIGRNGAGKSTLLKLLSRITEQTTGRIHLRGRVASLLEVGTGFHPELTGRENIYLNGAILGMSRLEIKSKFDEIVEFSGVERFLDTPVKRYSSGMYVRLAFAVAAHLEPEILIVDEVLAVGDAEFQKKCLGKMEQVAKESGRTILFVSHNMAAIQNLCNRCLFLDQGKLVRDGDTEDVVSAYLSSGTALAEIQPSERKDRQGANQVTVRNIAFFDAEGRSLKEAITGKTLVIRVSFSVDEGKLLRNCRVSLGVAKDALPYFVLSTDLVDKAPMHLSGRGYVDFIVPELPLSGGTYRIGSYVASDDDGITQDWLEDAAMFDVVDGDYFGTGKLYHTGWQGKSVLVRHSCRLGKDTERCAHVADPIVAVPD